mmetsp:Transcript_6286/g.18052  ORF Transcript_6286/g.18052 Transcript_6286/m.18052 type:complete len:298 (-) Transcript_6286:33-926(-)
MYSLFAVSALLFIEFHFASVAGFGPRLLPSRIAATGKSTPLVILRDYVDDSGPSDYDTEDLLPEQKEVTVDENEEDALIRDALKRELLLLASVTNRGEYASGDERDIAIDLVAQLEALNPTAQPASNCQGEWDLCLSSTQFFRSSPFFQAIRVVLNDRAMADNAFDLHDRATSMSRVGRVRQTVKSGELESEVDLEVGMMPGIPIRIKGTVVTSAKLAVVSDQKWELQVQNTKVKGSNIPIFNQILEDNLQIELPVGDFYSTVQGSVPVVPMTTLYVDESMRITRDIDDNFFVFTRC